MSTTRGYARIFTPETIDGSIINPPFTVRANTTSGDATITLVSTNSPDEVNTNNLVVGYEVTGTGIPVSSNVLSVTNSTVFELDANASANGSSVALTITPVTSSVTGRVVNPNLVKGFDLALKEMDNLGRIDLKRWDGRNVTGSIDLELISAATIFPRQGGTITLDGMQDEDLNVTYSINEVTAVYAKGNFVTYSLNIEHHPLVEGAP